MSSTPAEQESPLMIAWNNYKKSGHYQNIKHSLQTWPDTIDGCFWNAFYAGWMQANKESETVKQLKGMVVITEEAD